MCRWGAVLTYRQLRAWVLAYYSPKSMPTLRSCAVAITRANRSSRAVHGLAGKALSPKAPVQRVDLAGEVIQAERSLGMLACPPLVCLTLPPQL